MDYGESGLKVKGKFTRKFLGKIDGFKSKEGRAMGNKCLKLYLRGYNYMTLKSGERFQIGELKKVDNEIQ